MENTDSSNRAITASPTSVSNALTGTGETPLINISPVGNVIITVSGHDPSQSESKFPPLIRLRVNDTVIRSASERFSAMLFPRQVPERQSQVLSHPSDVWPLQPKEVFLPDADDNPQAMSIILCVLHLRNDLVAQVPKPRGLLQIALLADKYDLRRALKLASGAWLGRSMVDCMASGTVLVDLGIAPNTDPVFRPKMASKEIMDLVAAAWLFRERSAFAKLTVELAMRHQESFTSFLEDKLLEQALPKKCWILLAERTGRVHSQLLELIYILGRRNEPDGNPTSVCPHPTHFIDDYQQLYKRFGFGRVRPTGDEYPPIDLLLGIEAVNKHERMCPGCVCGSRELHPQTVQKELERIKKEVRICLDCVENRAEMVCSHLD
ncbi:hypothetical protein N0V85_006405 [Neurospora sp. IMI 360204]|nr:hypothetical protein N0V85_006405 [Neurospora sp. IMI 360204]